MNNIHSSSRRSFIKNIGYVSIGFSLLSRCDVDNELPEVERLEYEGDLPRSLKNAKKINAWLEVLEDGKVRVLSGKVELGQGIRIAIKQVAAEELDMDLKKVTVHLAETGVTPNEGYTAGSSSVVNSAMSVRYAAAKARQKLLELAATKMNTEITNLVLYNGTISSKTTGDSITFLEVLEGAQIDEEVVTPIQLKVKENHRYVGKAIPRTDIEKMVRGETVYVQDLRFPNMVHARILRPPNYDAKLLKLDDTPLKGVEGVLKTIVKGSFVAVITKHEYEAEKARTTLDQYAEWSITASFPEQDNLFEHIKNNYTEAETVKEEGSVDFESKTTKTVKATYTKPYIKHASLGPACAVALFDKEVLHIWTHSQGIYPLRDGIQSMLGLKLENIHLIGIPGAGCFGHSTADDAAADAAIIAMEYPGKHIRVQWSRQDEHRWDPYGSAVIVDLEASLDANNKIDSWKSDVWTDSQSTRPNRDKGTLLAPRYLEQAVKMKSRGYLSGGHRNGYPYYNIPNAKLDAYYFDGPLRVSSLRSLGSFTTIFAIESMMDTLAEKAGKDPLDFRLEHLSDKRAIAVIKKIQNVTLQEESITKREGIGYAYMRYKNTAAYGAVAAKVSVDTDSGEVSVKKMWAAVDVGEVINMDGIVNQVEGGMIQAASWTLKEEVTFSDKEITSSDWNGYPIFRFPDTPEVKVSIINRPNEPAEGGGEISMPPTGAAIANAVYNACGKRIYNLPIAASKILN